MPTVLKGKEFVTTEKENNRRITFAVIDLTLKSKMNVSDAILAINLQNWTKF